MYIMCIYGKCLRVSNHLNKYVYDIPTYLYKHEKITIMYLLYTGLL